MTAFRRCLHSYKNEEGANGEEGQEVFEDCAARIVLGGRPDNGIYVSCKRRT